jgi:hypothetical protein
VSDKVQEIGIPPMFSTSVIASCFVHVFNPADAQVLRYIHTPEADHHDTTTAKQSL